MIRYLITSDRKRAVKQRKFLSINEPAIWFELSHSAVRLTATWLCGDALERRGIPQFIRTVLIIIIISTFRAIERTFIIIIINVASVHRRSCAWRAFFWSRWWAIRAVHHSWQFSYVWASTLESFHSQSFLMTIDWYLRRKSINFYLFTGISSFFPFSSNYRYYYFPGVWGCHVINIYFFILFHLDNVN